jgi:TonB family protein
MHLARNALLCGLLAGTLITRTTSAGTQMGGPPISQPATVEFARLIPDSTSVRTTDTPGAAYRRGDFAKTIKLLKPLADAGGIDAQVMLGQMYLKGEGVKPDPAQALKWIHRAADQGSPIAAFDLGVFMSIGLAGTPDNRIAAEWYRRAAHHRYPDAAYNLAVLYHVGQGIDRSDPMALNWIDAGMRYLPSSAGEELRSRFTALRGAIVAGMPDEQVSTASRLLSPDGPVPIAAFRDKDSLLQRAVKESVSVRHSGRDGAVALLLLVRPDGTVGDIKTETSSGHPEFDTAIQHIFASATIEPQRIDGEPVESWQLAEFNWKAK